MTAALISARRKHIEDSAPCESCGDTLANCEAERGKDPTAPAEFGCCWRPLMANPGCNHRPDPAALLELLSEIESGTVRPVEEVTAKPAARGMAWTDYLDQRERWQPNGRPMVAVADMDPEWRYNASRWLERNADAIAQKYSLAEHVWLAAEAASPMGPSESSLDGIESDIAARAAARRNDPVAWIRGTALYQALVADLPTGETLTALAGRARHWSTCPVRKNSAAKCACHLSECAIRNGHPELGCTCRDTTPEWTLS